MFTFENKKILFIGPKTFNYENVIKEELESLGAEVIYFSDKPFKNKLLIILLRICPILLWGISKNHYIRKFKNYPSFYFDIIFIIKGEGVSPSLLKWMKLKYTNAHFVLYLWDSINNVKNIGQKFPYFDKILSFDPNDCQKYNFIKYRPLFFISNYTDVIIGSNNKSVFFLGTLNGDRRVVVSRIINIFKNTNIKLDISLLVRSKLELITYYTQLYFCKSLRINFYSIPANNLIRKPLTSSEINTRMSSCQAVLDVHHPGQSGLTMRTFEVLASGKKLITTNENVRNHDFYDPTLISIIDRNNPIINLNFLELESKVISPSFFSMYSCKGWLTEIFC